MAQIDIVEAADFIAQDSHTEARRWYAELRERLIALSDSPEAYAICPESEELGVELRQLHHHSHRVIFRVRKAEQVVEVLRVYHGSRRALDDRSLPD